jgi:hypothetical protein
MKFPAPTWLLIVSFAFATNVTLPVRAEELSAEDEVPGFASVRSVPPAPAAESFVPDAREQAESIYLPPLEQELQQHGGSYLYEPLDVVNRQQHDERDPHNPVLRLPECWPSPQPPCSLPNDFLGPGFVQWNPNLHGLGDDPYMWEPRFVLHGGYQLFGAYFDQGGAERNGIGHQLFVDLDYRLTGTERFHVQFRPLGEQNTGGSFWQLNSPQQYFDNSTAAPQRWWFEGELQSLFGPWGGDETRQLDVNFTVGRFLFRLHNGLLMNNEMVGVVVAKNNIISTPLSDLNIQLFYAPDQVHSFPANADLYGAHLTADYRHLFFEGTYAYLNRNRTLPFQVHYLAASATQFFGPLSLSGRTMYRIAGDTGARSGNFQTIESNVMRVPGEKVRIMTGIEQTVTYMNLFYASENWAPIAGEGISRLRSAFSVDPLLRIASGTMPPSERYGASLGVQLFRLHQDESLIPEFAYENRSSANVWGIGLRYQRKVNSRMFLELSGVRNWSPNPAFERKGVFLSSTVIF